MIFAGPRLVHQEPARIRCCSLHMHFGLKSQLDCDQLLSGMMQVYPGKRALFATAEMMTSGCYYGSEVPRYLSNTLFRAGGAAALLTNRPRARFTAKYRMVASTRSHGAGDNEAFKCVVGSRNKDACV